MTISRATSTYLDLVRWIAACAVMLYHFQDHHFGPDQITRYFPSNGRGYVMVFFVISGFVISMAARNKSATEFAIDRAVRIYIVALPVLLICATLSFAIPLPAEEYRRALDQPISTFLLNASFLSQSWSLSYFPY